MDLLAILPFYLELILTLFGVDDKKLRDLRWAFLVVRILRVLRVIRIIKLGRFSSGLQTFGMTLQRYSKDYLLSSQCPLINLLFYYTLKESKAIANDDHCAVDRGCVLFNNDLFLGEGRERITVHQHSSSILVIFTFILTILFFFLNFQVVHCHNDHRWLWRCCACHNQ